MIGIIDEYTIWEFQHGADPKDTLAINKILIELMNYMEEKEVSPPLVYLKLYETFCVYRAAMVREHFPESVMQQIEQHVNKKVKKRINDIATETKAKEKYR